MFLIQVTDIVDLFMLCVLFAISLVVLGASIEKLDYQLFQGRGYKARNHGRKVWAYVCGMSVGITLAVISGFNIAMVFVSA